MKRKMALQVNDKVRVLSGNFTGLTGIVKAIDWQSTNPRAIYGFYHKVLLSDGRTGYIEKSEHWEVLQ